ncbi:MAG: 3-hydroxyacyl-ACP dehydratase FabZ [Salaquimonas sp.]|jgi:3-hydroxyacyl-[acyl-carrier-protein] dehydratase|nr:3-hydroxyacyl-ACP dehydratase FabZ [Salaquimonas sp.]
MSETLDQISIIEIFKLLPHRYPFLLIDRIVDIDEDNRATGIKNVTFNEPHFNGHFPGEPIMPGVLIVEAMAQTCGAIVANRHLMGARKLVYFMTIDGAKFRKPVVPGDVLKIEVEKRRQRGNIFKYDCVAYVEGAKVAEALISAMMVDPEEKPE